MYKVALSPFSEEESDIQGGYNLPQITQLKMGMVRRDLNSYINTFHLCVTLPPILYTVLCGKNGEERKVLRGFPWFSRGP